MDGDLELMRDLLEPFETLASTCATLRGSVSVSISILGNVLLFLLMHGEGHSLASISQLTLLSLDFVDVFPHLLSQAFATTLL